MAEPSEFYNFYLAFPFPDSASQEIFMGEWGGYNFEDFSQSGTDCRNPEFFIGENHPWNYYCFYVYLVWEEFRNGHWMIRSSKTEMCYGGIEEANENDDNLKTWPNPFREELTVSYSLVDDGFVEVYVYDVFGRRISTVFSGRQLSGEQLLTWDGRDGNGEVVASGIYLVRFFFGNRHSVIKVLKVD